MRMAPVEDPTRYQDLYVFDFGAWTAVGYTAAEVAMLLEDPRYRAGKVYRIHAARPDGTFELQGVSAERFELESAMLFYRADLGPARQDYDDLLALAAADPPPCRAYVQLVDRGSAAAAPQRFAVALVYPAEHDPQIARWLSEHDYAGGDTAEGTTSGLADFLREDKHIVARQQLLGRESIASRSADEVFASVRRAVQR